MPQTDALVLVVDDDPAINSMLRRAFTAEGRRVVTADDGPGALESVRVHGPDLVVLDLGLPEIDGLEVCRRLRAAGDEVPVLMLTARGEVADRVTGLETGADDYLVKPFALEELLARVDALLRRRPPSTDVLRFADVVMDTAARTASRAGRDLALSRREFDLLETFLRHPRQVLGRFQLMEDVWGYDLDIETNTVDVYVGYLRRKLEADGATRLVQTVRGVGFKLDDRA